MEIYTIGHGNMPLPEFMSLLVRYEIAAVIDVRSIPASRHVPQYNKGTIEKELEVKGIRYLYLEDESIGNFLGGRPKDSACYVGGVVDYELVRQRPWFKLWISEVALYAKKHRIALMCAEEDPYRCHRHYLLSQSLISQGVKVYHIRRDGSLEEARKEVKQSLLSSYLRFS